MHSFSIIVIGDSLKVIRLFLFVIKFTSVPSLKSKDLNKLLHYTDSKSKTHSYQVRVREKYIY